MKKIRNFGDRLKQSIKDSGFKNKSLAKKLGVHPNTLTRWINEERLPDIDMAYQISTELNCSLEWLITGKDERVQMTINQVGDLSEEDQKRLQGRIPMLTLDEVDQIITFMEQSDETRKKVLELVEALVKSGEE